MPSTVAVACDVCAVVMDAGFTVTATEVICGAGTLCPGEFPHPAASSAHTTAPPKPPAHRIVRIAFSPSIRNPGNLEELYAFPAPFPVRRLTRDGSRR